MTGEVRGSWGGKPPFSLLLRYRGWPCHGCTEDNVLQGDLVESVWDCSGRRKGGWGGETAGMFWPAVERSQPAREEGLWTSKVPFVPFRVAEQPGHWL